MIGLALAPRSSSLRATLASVLLAFVIVALTAWAIRDTLVYAATYYGGRPWLAANYVRFTSETSALAERAAWIQARSGGVVRYAWGEGVGGGVRYVRTASGSYPLRVVRAGELASGRVMVAGYVENGTGAVVLAVTGQSTSSCRIVALRTSPHARSSASIALVPDGADHALPTPEAVDGATWAPLDGASEPCPPDLGAKTVLLRFDRPTGARWQPVDDYRGRSGHASG